MLDFANIIRVGDGKHHFTLRSWPSSHAQPPYQDTVMNKEQVKGRIEEAKGKVKEVAGKVLDDPGMEARGNVQKNVGKVQAGAGDIKADVKKSR
jgi:uncharacterized protein YjbJ (UPF0337 family)